MGGDPSACRFNWAAAQPRASIYIAPTTPIEVVRAGEAGNELIPMRWGLVPSWWKKSLSELPSTFNARAETVADKPMFRAAFKTRRCIIAASGFYEWTGKAGAKTPHYFSAPSGEPLALAGLWERWRDPESDATFDSATIIVGAAGKWMSRFHDRMPIILEWSSARDWMRGANPGRSCARRPKTRCRNGSFRPASTRQASKMKIKRLLTPSSALDFSGEEVSDLWIVTY